MRRLTYPPVQVIAHCGPPARIFRTWEPRSAFPTSSRTKRASRSAGSSVEVELVFGAMVSTRPI
jgi:hypothetical protein